MRLKTSINRFALLAVLLAGGALLLSAARMSTVDLAPPELLTNDGASFQDTIQGVENIPGGNPILIDISSAIMDAPQLMAVAETVIERLNRSQLFEPVENQFTQQRLSDLEQEAIRNLPILFTAGELQRQVIPLLSNRQIRSALIATRDNRYRSDDGGQAPVMAADPLGLRHLVLARLFGSTHASEITIRSGSRTDAVRQHLVLLATPIKSSADTTAARFLHDLKTAIQMDFGAGTTLSPLGKSQTDPGAAGMSGRHGQRAIWWAVAAGTGILLLILFSGPVLCLLALLPAMTAAAMVFFIFALNYDTIPVMGPGIGSVLIFTSLIHAAIYLILVDGSPDQHGRLAWQEARALGLPAALSAVGTCAALAASGFEEVGWFGALGTGFSVVFTYTVLPWIVPANRLTGTSTGNRLLRFTDRLVSTGTVGLVVALFTAVFLAVFIRPMFSTDLKPSDSAGWNSRAMDEWMLTRAPDMTSLQAVNNRLLEHLHTEMYAGRIEKPVTPSLFFPGPVSRAANFKAWQSFWTEARIDKVSMAMKREGTDLGLAHSASDAFLKMLAADFREQADIPTSLRPLLGIFNTASDGPWLQITRITPRETFDRQQFYDRMGDLCVAVDAAPASQGMLRAISGASIKLLMVAGGILFFLLIVFIADVTLLLITLLPLGFALICTLGTLGIMGRALDIPAIVLPVILLGTGAGYPLFVVRGYQRYLRFDHPQFARVRMALVMAAGLTLSGLALLAGTDDGFFNIVGWTSFLGLGYCLTGTMLILPPLLKWRFEGSSTKTADIARRYRHMAPYPRMAARYRQRLDPVLDELAAQVPANAAMTNILDVGCGYGVPACWLADRFPDATIHGIEPQAERVRVAALALGNRGTIVKGAAPDLPPMDVLLDLATLLDVSHYLQDWELEKTLERIHERLLPGGLLIMRSVLPPAANPHWTLRLMQARLKFSGINVCYRDRDAAGAILDKCRFNILRGTHGGRARDRYWHVATPR